MGCGAPPCPSALVTILTSIEYTKFELHPIRRRDVWIGVVDEKERHLKYVESTDCGAFHAFTTWRHTFLTVLHSVGEIMGVLDGQIEGRVGP